MTLLVYLDTSHHDLLVKAKERDRREYASFLGFWKDAECELALTMFHTLELRRHNDERVRAARYALFQDLLPIVLDIRWPDHSSRGTTLLLEREIVLAFIRKRMLYGSGEGAQEEAARWAAIFPGRLSTVVEARAFQMGTERGDIGWAADLAFDALRSAAKAMTRPVDQRYESPKLKSIPARSPGEIEFNRIVQQAEAAVGQEEPWKDLERLVPPEAIAALKYASAVMMREALRHQAEVGPRQAVAGTYGVSADGEALGSSLDDLRYDWSLRSSVDSVIRRLMPIDDPEQHSRALSAIQPADCPGTWLRNAVEVQLRKATPAPEPGDEYDLGHIAHLPYVDLLTTDKRICEFASKVLGRADVPELLRDVRPPVRAKNIAELSRALESTREAAKGQR